MSEGKLSEKIAHIVKHLNEPKLYSVLEIKQFPDKSLQRFVNEITYDDLLTDLAVFKTRDELQSEKIKEYQKKFKDLEFALMDAESLAEAHEEEKQDWIKEKQELSKGFSKEIEAKTLLLTALKQAFALYPGLEHDKVICDILKKVKR
jgi:hypothetical protein